MSALWSNFQELKRIVLILDNIAYYYKLHYKDIFSRRILAIESLSA